MESVMTKVSDVICRTLRLHPGVPYSEFATHVMIGARCGRSTAQRAIRLMKEEGRIVTKADGANVRYFFNDDYKPRKGEIDLLPVRRKVVNVWPTRIGKAVSPMEWSMRVLEAA